MTLPPNDPATAAPELDPASQALFADLIENLLPFNVYLGMKVVSLRQGRVSLAVPFKEELVGDYRRGAVHGGVISALIDTCAGFAVWTMCSVHDRIATIDVRADYLRPAIRDVIVAEAVVRQFGNRVANATASVYCGRERLLVAEGRGVYNIRRAK